MDHYLGGPFADRSGGLIAFDAASSAEAERLVEDDPFPQRGLGFAGGLGGLAG
ncbi:MAG TPA: YciI family protein [Acidimicrobiia bacterium]|nr:YciI family protein [Acidimicrobiia bacterium]